jgi:hypothetical protein
MRKLLAHRDRREKEVPGRRATRALKDSGLFWMAPEAVEDRIRTLAVAEVRAAADMFTHEKLEKAYEGKTTL